MTATWIAFRPMVKANSLKSSKPGLETSAESVVSAVSVAPDLAGTLDRGFEHHMKRCRTAWQAGVTMAVAEAVSWCRAYRRPPPDWLDAAVLHGLKARLSRAEVKRRIEDQAHYVRWDMVNELHERKTEFAERDDDRATSWDRIYATVADLLGDREPETVRQSYMRVARDMREGRAAKYFVGTAHLLHPADST